MQKDFKSTSAKRDVDLLTPFVSKADTDVTRIIWFDLVF